MASLEDYDEFGNYIGADLDSDDEEEVEQIAPQPLGTAAPPEGYDDEQTHESENDLALMEVDGVTTYIIFKRSSSITISRWADT